MQKIKLKLVLACISITALLMLVYFAPQPVETLQTDQAAVKVSSSAQFKLLDTFNSPQIENSPVVKPVETSAWTALSQLPVEKVMPHIRSDIVDKTLVKIDRALIDSWRVDDFVRLPIPQKQKEIVVQIDSIELLPSSNQLIAGHVPGSPNHVFIMTVGKQSIFATIGTEDGVFNLRGNENYAWIISSRELKQHLRPEILDYRVQESR